LVRANDPDCHPKLAIRVLGAGTKQLFIYDVYRHSLLFLLIYICQIYIYQFHYQEQHSVNLEETNEMSSELQVSLEDSQFYSSVFSLAVKRRQAAYAKESDNLKRVSVEEYEELTRRLDRTKFQESCAVRNILRTRRLANLLINDKGELNASLLPRVIGHLKEHLYSLGPQRQYDAKRQEHILNVLVTLKENKEVARLLKNISKPYSHKRADQIIRDTLQLPEHTPVTDAHARRAVLSAWMCYLRQNIGSCFATAPAIIVHDEQPEMFLKDINELLSTGRLKRTFGGVEYSVPLSSSWGAGDLKKPFYLPSGDSLEQCEIWQAPGLLAAFEASGLLNPNSSLEEKIEKTKHLIFKRLKELGENQPYIITTAEEIIRNVLLNHFSLTEQDLRDYENRPKSMIQSNLLMQVSRVPLGGGGKGEACSNFLVQFQNGCNALKALADNALLKAWEFTVASFAETKAQFTRWNLYSSLGLGPNEKGGIGACLYEIIKTKLEQCNQKVKEFQFEYEQVFNQLKTLEVRMRHVSSEKEAQWVRVEYQSKRNEFYALEDIRDDVHQRAHRFANLFDALVEQYDNLFPRYFQEVYDADMFDVSSGPYDDSPAGFRLLYKYGRSNTSQWSLIKNPNDFIECLATFFVNTETEIAASPAFQGIQNDLSEIVTAVVNHVRTKEFLETAFFRMAAAHQTRAVKDPLEHLEQIEKKPWAYTSGGTMSTLVSCYYRLEQKPTEVSRWMENPVELLVFLIDTLKQIPPKFTENYLKNPKKSMLIHSPTHAFLLKPGITPFKEAWMSDAYTYTWVRDNIIVPRQKFVENIWLDDDMMQFLVNEFAKFVPENFRHYFLKTFARIPRTMGTVEFRNYLLDATQREKGLKYEGRGVLNADDVDSTLFSLLPLFSRFQLKERLENLFNLLPDIDAEKKARLLNAFDRTTGSLAEQNIISATALQDICKGLLCLAFEETTTTIDYHDHVSRAAQKLGYAMPSPIIFADTNWVKDEFGCVVNPGTGRLELWRVDSIGAVGMPMTAWEQWINGSRRDALWGVYTKPYEYSP
jgi:hypothetical protein